MKRRSFSISHLGGWQFLRCSICFLLRPPLFPCPSFVVFLCRRSKSTRVLLSLQTEQEHTRSSAFHTSGVISLQRHAEPSDDFSQGLSPLRAPAPCKWTPFGTLARRGLPYQRLAVDTLTSHAPLRMAPVHCHLCKAAAVEKKKPTTCPAMRLTAADV